MEIAYEELRKITRLVDDTMLETSKAVLHYEDMACMVEHLKAANHHVNKIKRIVDNVIFPGMWSEEELEKL